MALEVAIKIPCLLWVFALLTAITEFLMSAVLITSCMGTRPKHQAPNRSNFKAFWGYFLKKSTVFSNPLFLHILWMRTKEAQSLGGDGINSALFYGIRKKSSTLSEKSSLLHHHIPVWDTALGRIWSKKRPFVLRQVLNISASFEKVFPVRQEEPLENAASMTWMPNKKIQGAIAAVTAYCLKIT